VWQSLDDQDECASNPTPQVAFIDDGLVVSGTGGYLCTTWCYGPGDFIVNPEGGLAGSDVLLRNEVWSPAIAWPAVSDGYNGCMFSFDVYVHELLRVTSPGMFYVWHVRSTASADPGDLAGEPWRDWGYL
jgi:hypothetical protein